MMPVYVTQEVASLCNSSHHHPPTHRPQPSIWQEYISQKAYILIAVNGVMVLHKVKFQRSKDFYKNNVELRIQCILVTGVHTGVVDALGGLLLVVSDMTHLHLCDLQGVGGLLPVIPDYSLPTG